MRIVGRNVAVGRGEIDLCAFDERTRVVVEVRTVTGSGDAIDAVGNDKRDHVGALAARAGAQRVDLVGIRLGAAAIEVHWVPGIAR